MTPPLVEWLVCSCGHRERFTITTKFPEKERERVRGYFRGKPCSVCRPSPDNPPVYLRDGDVRWEGEIEGDLVVQLRTEKEQVE